MVNGSTMRLTRILNKASHLVNLIWDVYLCILLNDVDFSNNRAVFEPVIKGGIGEIAMEVHAWFWRRWLWKGFSLYVDVLEYLANEMQLWYIQPPIVEICPVTR